MAAKDWNSLRGEIGHSRKQSCDFNVEILSSFLWSLCRSKEVVVWRMDSILQKLQGVQHINTREVASQTWVQDIQLLSGNRKSQCGIPYSMFRLFQQPITQLFNKSCWFQVMKSWACQSLWSLCAKNKNLLTPSSQHLESEQKRKPRENSQNKDTF